ncbi:MAG TPA: heavy metal-binding domain-containing protein, partial [Thermotogaceae bacterium]|nr:heavy metal-binding domain-containing protein [Thermotogaceae bacterium]
MIVVTTETVANAEIEKVLGLVQGSVVRSKHLGRDI